MEKLQEKKQRTNTKNRAKNIKNDNLIKSKREQSIIAIAIFNIFLNLGAPNFFSPGVD